MKVFLPPFFRVKVPRCSGSEEYLVEGLGGLVFYAVVSLDSVVGRPAACSWSSGRLALVFETFLKCGKSTFNKK